MIVIEKPLIYKHGNLFRLESKIIDEKINKTYKIYYEVEEQYKFYLCSEVADCFVTAVLPTAAKTGQDIIVHSNVSPKLMFGISDVHAEYLSSIFSSKKISVIADQSEFISFGASAVATPCSLGVDSLASIYKFTSNSCHPDYRLTHLAYFGACHLGTTDQETLNPIFNNTFAEKKKFADEIGLPIVAINTNLADLYRNNNFKFDYVVEYYNASCVLALQKLFKRYAVPSSNSVKDMHICKKVDDNVESTFVPYFSTENTDIFMVDSYMSRIEKTKLIYKNPLTPRYLDVCVAVRVAHLEEDKKTDKYLKVKTKRNCGCCIKCLRTLLTLEAYGVIDDYKDAFDLDNYKKNRNMFITYAIAHSNDVQTLYGINKLLDDGNIKLSLFAKFLKFVVRHNASLAIWIQHKVFVISNYLRKNL